MEDYYKNKVEKNQFETPKRYSVKNSDKTQDNEAFITQKRHRLLIDSDESNTSEFDNDNEKLSGNVTVSISSQQVNIRNDNIKKSK